MVHIIEIRNYKEVCPTVLDDLKNLIFDSKAELIEALAKLGLPDTLWNTLWNVRVHSLDDFISLVNYGESFGGEDGVVQVELNFTLEPGNDRLIEF